MKTLRMKFSTDLGKTFVVSMNYAKDSITALEADAAMQAILDNEIFAEDLVGIAGAELVDRTVTTIL